MPRKKATDPLDVEVGGKAIREWKKEWQPVAGGFRPKRSELRHFVGLGRAVLNGETKYIFCAADPKGGIEKGLQRIRGKKQTGNAGSGAQAMIAHFDELELEILIVGKDRKSGALAELLKPALVRHYNPEWHAGHRRRMERIRRGEKV